MQSSMTVTSAVAPGAPMVSLNPRLTGRAWSNAQRTIHLSRAAWDSLAILTPEEHERMEPDQQSHTFAERFETLCQNIDRDAIEFREFLLAVDAMGMGKSLDLLYLLRCYTQRSSMPMFRDWQKKFDDVLNRFAEAQDRATY